MFTGKDGNLHSRRKIFSISFHTKSAPLYCSRAQLKYLWTSFQLRDKTTTPNVNAPPVGLQGAQRTHRHLELQHEQLHQLQDELRRSQVRTRLRLEARLQKNRAKLDCFKSAKYIFVFFQIH